MGFIILAHALVLLNTLDVVQTRYGLRRGHPERNPIAKPFIMKNFWLVCSIKMALAVGSAILLVLAGELIPLILLVSFSFACCSWNSFVLIRGRRKRIGEENFASPQEYGDYLRRQIEKKEV